MTTGVSYLAAASIGIVSLLLSPVTLLLVLRHFHTGDGTISIESVLDVFASSQRTKNRSRFDTVEYFLVGVSGGLQDGFPERNKMDYHVGEADEVKAIYVGKGLVRGYKAFLDVMEPGWRQYVEEPGQPYINSNVIASGCYEHANEYWVYLIDSRQVMSVLNNEPRFLSITPDTGKVELYAEETTPLVKDIFLSLIRQKEASDEGQVGLPLVTCLWFQYESHVPSPPIKVKEDGTMITNFPESLAKWAGVNDEDRTAVLEACSEDSGGDCPQAQEAWGRYWEGVRKAIRKAEDNRPSEEAASIYGPPFQCEKRVSFGVQKTTARINFPLTAFKVTEEFEKFGYLVDFEKGKLVKID